MNDLRFSFGDKSSLFNGILVGKPSIRYVACYHVTLFLAKSRPVGNKLDLCDPPSLKAITPFLEILKAGSDFVLLGQRRNGEGQ